MKDIDFDELDKAVTSLMGSVPSADETVKPDDDIKTLVLTPSKPLTMGGFSDSLPVPSATPASTPVSITSTPTPAAESTPIPTLAPVAPAPQVSPAARRAGRFMDVVHPSSDMTKSTMGISRHSGVIEPLNSDVVAEPTVVSTPAPVVPDEPTTAEVHSDLSDLSHHATSDWPDPLDMLQDAPVQPDETLVTETSEPVIADTTPTLPAEPLSSPFLPDAKVEKRPLGGATPDPLGDELETPVLNNDAPTPSNDPQIVPAEIVLPEELQGDLMAIESRQADTAPAVEPIEPKSPITLAPAQPQVQSVSAPTQPTGPTSITQQYKAEPSTGDQTNGSIYDTDTYHKPLEHPVKKKSSVALIIWIVVLLIIGAGGGAAAYFYLLK